MRAGEIESVISTVAEYTRSYPHDSLRFIVFVDNSEANSNPAVACEHWPVIGREEPKTIIEIVKE